MNDLMEILYQALETEHGLAVETNDPERLRQRLYAERKKEPDLNVLSFVQSRYNPTGELWIIKNAQGED